MTSDTERGAGAESETVTLSSEREMGDSLFRKFTSEQSERLCLPKRSEVSTTGTANLKSCKGMSRLRGAPDMRIQ